MEEKNQKDKGFTRETKGINQKNYHDILKEHFNYFEFQEPDLIFAASDLNFEEDYSFILGITEF